MRVRQTLEFFPGASDQPLIFLDRRELLAPQIQKVHAHIFLQDRFHLLRQALLPILRNERLRDRIQNSAAEKRGVDVLGMVGHGLRHGKIGFQGTVKVVILVAAEVPIFLGRLPNFIFEIFYRRDHNEPAHGVEIQFVQFIEKPFASVKPEDPHG